jgi:hypothetical protein
MEMWSIIKIAAPYAAMENPVSVLWKHVTEPVQYIQPWEYGHKEMKKTGFALHNLPLLKSTSDLIPPAPGTRENVLWQKVWRMSPGPERKKMRSRTYQGVAEAIADQWTDHIFPGNAIAVVRDLHVGVPQKPTPPKSEDFPW